MPSMMKPKVKVKSDQKPSAGTRIKTGGTEDVPVRVKALPEPKVSRGSAGDMKAPPMGNFMDDSAPAAPGRSFFGGGRGEIEPDYGAPVERMPSMIRGIGQIHDMGPDHISVMPGGGPRGVFSDASINPDGSVSGRNSDNEFEEWANDNPRMFPMDIGPGSANEQARRAYREEFERGRSGLKPPQKTVAKEPAVKKKKKKKLWAPRGKKENYVDIMGGGAVKKSGGA